MKTSYTIQNLKCGGCAHTISTKIGEIDHIENIQVDVEKSSVSFEYQNEEDTQKVQEKLAHLGYPIVGDKNTVISKAKSFVSCATGKMAQ
ncbi:MAG: heavy-metal-associated domain-containing protein [Flavobacteriales bacterium]